jgi:hypothetical protein
MYTEPKDPEVNLKFVNVANPDAFVTAVFPESVPEDAVAVIVTPLTAAFALVLSLS